MNRTMNLKGFVLILGIILVVFMTAHLLLRGELNRKTDEEKGLRVTLTQMEEKHQNLTTQLNVVGTDDYIVTSAMQNYSYVNKNDIRFEFTNPEALYAYTDEEIQIMTEEMAD